MERSDLSKRIVEQFSEQGERADIWRAFDLLLPTNEFLNLGYSRWYQTHLFGSPQLRLVERIVDEFSSMDADLTAGRLLDVGCGRGGAARHVVETHGATVIGIDLVPYNIAVARSQTAESRYSPSFVIGDATCIPFVQNAFSGCYAIDSIVYVPDKQGVFAELSRVLEPDGICVVSDLLVSADSEIDARSLRRFCDTWDMPSLWTLERYRTAIESAGLSIVRITDLTTNSVTRFRKWTKLFLLLADGPFSHLLKTILAGRGLRYSTIVEQVRTAHDVLPALRHLLVVIRADSIPQ